MECFLCDNVQSETIIWGSVTKYRKIPLSSMLYEFIKKDVEIVIENDERICEMCKVLIDELDFFRHRLENIENVLAHKLYRKYKIDCTKSLSNIRIDEQTAALFVSENNTEQQFKCKKCSYSTNQQDCLVPHALIHGDVVTVKDFPIEDFECEHCHLVLSSDSLLKEHITSFHSNTVNHDDENGLNEIVQADERLDSDTEDTFNCNRCEEKFGHQNEKALTEHLTKVHFICVKCNRKCRNAKTLSNHIKLRHIEHVCEICGKKLNSLLSYKAHISSHDSNQKFTCSYCNKGFRAKSLLTVHIAIHTKEANYICHYCGEKFIHERAHRLHLQWHKNPRPYQCVECNKSFKHSSHLAVHRRTHSGDRPNACPHCEKRFITASKLKHHLAIHTGIYSHRCSVCEKGFTKLHKLANHMLRVHGDDSMTKNKNKCEYKVVINPMFDAFCE